MSYSVILRTGCVGQHSSREWGRSRIGSMECPAHKNEISVRERLRGVWQLAGLGSLGFA